MFRCTWTCSGLVKPRGQGSSLLKVMTPGRLDRSATCGISSLRPRDQDTAGTSCCCLRLPQDPRRKESEGPHPLLGGANETPPLQEGASKTTPPQEGLNQRSCLNQVYSLKDKTNNSTITEHWGCCSEKRHTRTVEKEEADRQLTVFTKRM